ncbi:MAG TPA: pyridoxal-phosphate dependent enzyme [Gemmatimonadaceae bacterium]|nr:pyridoxal-phosphate dependent enzyme [Gemmatimonadaceae bacterium]
MSLWPITFDDVLAARERLRPYLDPSPLRTYPVLDAFVGHEIRVLVKHENLNPTNAFKIRNALSFMTALAPDERRRGIVAASKGNHGLGLAYAGGLLGAPVTICVPVDNNPEKNAAILGYGATLIERGADYDDSAEVAAQMVEEQGLVLAHSTNDARVIAGAATLTLELIEQAPEIDAMVIAVGGGSQAVGAMTVLGAERPTVRVTAVQAAGASAAHDSWHAGAPRTTATALTFADGLATRAAYAMTFPALLDGLEEFVTVTDAEIASALRLLLSTTHTLVEGAAAAGLAALLAHRDRFAGQQVGIILSGGNIDAETLRRVMAHEI